MIPLPSAIQPDAFVLLARSHDDLRHRFDALVAPPSRRALVEAGLWLNVHAALAMALVYPAMRGGTPGDPSLALAEMELQEVLQALESALAADASSGLPAERLAALRRLVDRQFADEEVALFTQLAAADLDVDELGRRFLEQRRDLVAELGLVERSH